jgi:glyoxylase-like metal-dependent hydrolase (beta-lactamase superfamily II)
MALPPGADRLNYTLKVGDVTVTALTDGTIRFDQRVLFPDVPLEAWEPFYDRFPEYFSGPHFQNNIGAFVFSSNGKSVIADTGFGPHGKMLGEPAPGELMRDMERKGALRQDIDVVFMTHLHGDHVGWNMHEDGDASQPTFPNARYRVHEADWAHFTREEVLAGPRGEAMNRSVLPVERNGLLDLMDGETELAPGVTAFHTPGHTPGHMSLLIASQNQRALLIGDIAGSPMQLTETEWRYSPDWDAEMGRQARRAIIEKAVGEDAIVMGAHLSYPGWGRIVTWEGRRYWKALQD